MSTSQQTVQKIVSATATKGPNGSNLFTLSTDEVDRDGDRIAQDGWNLAAYKQNPIVLWGHDHKSLPIGKCLDIQVVNGKLKGTVTWPPPGLYPFADQLHDLVNAGFLRSASVGFTADRSEPNSFGGHDIKAATLLEWSIVNIPSNPSALLERGVDRLRLKNWLGSNVNAQPREGYVMRSTDWVEIDDEPYFELLDSKDMSPFEHMCQQMLANYAEMDSEKFRELMRIQLALLGPAASIVDLVHALSQQGVATPRSAPGMRHMTEPELLLYKQGCDRRAGYYPY